MKSIAKSRVVELVEELGHRPEDVTAITIHPGYIIVEYTHPIRDDARRMYEHVIVDNDGES